MNNTIEEIRERIDILDLVRQTATGEKRAGRVTAFICPYHGEKTASMVVYPDQGRWYCYGACKQGGDIFSWVQRRDNVDFFSALQILARQAGVELPSYSNEDQAKHDEREAAQHILQAA